jgi:histidine ammonia-lyase
LKNVRKVLAIELYTSARAMDLRLRQSPDLSMSNPIQSVFDTIRKRVPYQAADRVWGMEIDQVEEMIVSGELLQAVAKG